MQPLPPYFSTLIGRPPLLVIQCDLLVMRAAVVRAQGRRLLVEAEVELPLSEPDADFAQAAELLKPQVKRWPRRGLVVSPEVFPALLELPLDPAKPPPAAELDALFRWELEPLFLQSASLWPLGTLLVAREQLSPEQLSTVVAHQQDLSARGLDTPFGTVAAELGLLAPEDLEAILGLQRWLRPGADELVCAYRAQGGYDAELGSSCWLACATPRARVSDWRRRLAQAGVELEALYPLVALAGAAQAAKPEHTARSVLELHPGAVAYSEWQEGSVRTLRVHQGSLQPSPDSLASLCQTRGNEPGPLFLMGAAAQAPGALELLAAGLGRAVAPLPQAGQGMQLAASDAFFGQGPGRGLARVPARPPALPWRRRIEPWGAIAAAGLLAFVAISESWLAARAARLEQEETQASEQLEHLEREKENIEQRTGEVGQLRARLAKAQAELKASEDRLRFLTEGYPEQTRFAPRLLDALSLSVSEEVVLNRLEQTETGELRIDGWALRDTAAQGFFAGIARFAERNGLRIADESVAAGKGPLGLAGQHLELQLLPASRKEGQKP